MMQRLRKLDLKKTPSISETLDWARALLALNASNLDEELVSDTLNVILKYEGDIKKAQSELGRLIVRKAEEEGAKAEEAPAEATPSRHRPRRRACSTRGLVRANHVPRAGSRPLACSRRSSSSRTCSGRAGCGSRSPSRSTPSPRSTSSRIDDREIFQDALRATMVKRNEDIPTFDQLFELYWSSYYDNLKQAPSKRPPRAAAKERSTSTS